VNVYLVQSGGGWILIDTGFNKEEVWTRLTTELAACGVAPETLRHIVLTHVHPDHSGLVPRLRELSGAPVWLHEEDARMLDEMHTTPVYRDSMEQELAVAETPENLRAEVRALHERLLGMFPHFQPDRFLAEGSRFETVLGPLHSVWTPGHSPGHCCLYAPECRLLFSGDHVLQDLLPHAGFIPGQDMLATYLGTFERLRELEVERILPSHGVPFAGLGQWLDRTEATHRRRMARVKALKAEGLTPHEMVRVIWPRDLRTMDYQLALTRVLGYLERLARQSRQEAGSIASEGV
jgi:glyoxylase-like metal-dependent hydrolase (beta-lactamase superfamily II)